MINQNLHKQPVALDRIKHRALRLDTTARNLDEIARMNAFFLAGTEFGDACKEYPVVFVHAGQDETGKALVAPIAVFGLQAEQNLCIEADGWRVRYVPAMLRMYPFAMARAGQDQLVMCIDESWHGFGTTGEALFDEAGEPSSFTLEVQKTLEAFEQDVERTRLACQLLLDKGLLREMRFDATLGDGSKVAVDGFLTVDEAKLAALNDADLLALNRNGLMGLIHAHQISLGNMTRLVEWHAQRHAGAAPTAPAAATPA